MKLTYSLTEEDFLQHQLYVASQSDRIKKKRQKSRVNLAIAYLVMSGYFLWQGEFVVTLTFVMIAILWYLLIPGYEAKRYRKHYQGFIREGLKNKIGEVSSIEFGDDFLFCESGKSESKISVDDFEEFLELKKYFFLKLKQGERIIIPKRKISNVDAFRDFIKKYEVDFFIETDWEWK